jgi:hypothetical protein
MSHAAGGEIEDDRVAAGTGMPIACGLVPKRACLAAKGATIGGRPATLTQNSEISPTCGRDLGIVADAADMVGVEQVQDGDAAGLRHRAGLLDRIAGRGLAERDLRIDDQEGSGIEPGHAACESGFRLPSASDWK